LDLELIFNWYNMPLLFSREGGGDEFLASALNEDLTPGPSHLRRREIGFGIDF
jgi:hypothetical protein